MNNNVVSIGGRSIGRGHPAFLVVEVAQAHEGSLGMAHSFIDVAADSGADAIKFQTHIASAESTFNEPFRTKFSVQDDSRYAYWKRMEFTMEQWGALADHAKERGLIFLSSAFSLEAVDMLSTLGMPAWKLGSGEFRSHELINSMIATGRPIILSTGMSSWKEIEEIVLKIKKGEGGLVLLQCTSQYPTALEAVGLNVLDEYSKRFNCLVGLSDHSGVLWPGLAALARGVHMLEVHITFHQKSFGPDVPASLTPDQVRLLADARDAFYLMDSNPIDKDVVVAKMSELRSVFGKSVALKWPLMKGDVLTAEVLTDKKPGFGISMSKIDSLIGRRLARDVSADYLLSYEDLEDLND